MEKTLSSLSAIGVMLFLILMLISIFLPKDTFMDYGWKLTILGITFGILSIHLHISSISEGKIVKK